MGVGFLDWCDGLADHRVSGMITYPLTEIIFSAFIGIMCGGDDWEEISLIASEKIDFLRQFLAYDNGVAPEQTMRRCFASLDSKSFQDGFTAWVAGIAGSLQGVIAIDGKTLRGTRDCVKAKKPLHLLSAFAHEAGLVTGQQAVDEKSNEITAIPQLLEKFCIKGCIVTIDAMGTQKAVAQKIRHGEADYVPALKGNQSLLAGDVRDFFNDPVWAATCASVMTTDLGHGRIEERSCLVSENPGWLCSLHPDWTDLRSIAAAVATRTDKASGVTSTETRYYISSLPANPMTILGATRSHWSIENNLHWVMDVTFNDDQSRARDKNIALNFAVLKHAALNTLKRVPAKLSIKSKQKKAALNNAFLIKSWAQSNVNNL
jgi:predicted transposase YbfD/YdcC